MEFFHLHFPEIAKNELRSATVQERNPLDLPGGEYGFMEAYCTEPGCDCRRVMLNVLHKEIGLVAVIGFGFDPEDSMGAPMLDPLNPQSQYAERILDLTCNVILRDPAYVARLERHYRLVKEKFEVPSATASKPKQTEARWWKRKRRKPRR